MSSFPPGGCWVFGGVRPAPFFSLAPDATSPPVLPAAPSPPEAVPGRVALAEPRSLPAPWLRLLLCKARRVAEQSPRLGTRHTRAWSDAWLWRTLKNAGSYCHPVSAVITNLDPSLWWT